MEHCHFCGTLTDDYYCFYYGTKHDEPSETKSSGGRAPTKVAFQPLPVTVPMCDSCVSRRFKVNNTSITLRWPLALVGMAVTFYAGAQLPAINTGASFLPQVLGIIIGVAGIVLSFTVIPFTKYRDKLDCGELLAIKVAAPILKTKDFDFFMPASLYYEKFVNWAQDIPSLIRKGDSQALLHALALYGGTAGINNQKRDLAVMAAQGLQSVGNPSILAALLKKRQALLAQNETVVQPNLKSLGLEVIAAVDQALRAIKLQGK